MKQQPIAWISFLVVWISNLNDLIRGKWFFYSVESILFWNFMGVLGFILIILTYREQIKDAKCVIDGSEVRNERIKI